MTAEFGVFFLILALLTALLQSAYLLPFAGFRALLTRVFPIASFLQNSCIALALLTLITLRLDSDFSVINVIKHSNLALPTLYKIAGAWGNHEGSMLLWVFVLSLFGALLPTTSNQQPTTNFAIAIQSALCAGFLAFILFTSNPFARQFPPTIDGEALNPLLQDMALSIHPPLLYLGYVGFSIVFSLAVAGLITGKVDRAWAEIAHPWIMSSWSALTLGIGLGSWWAYRELGWGGWWFWDPVENASLMPWLAGTALFHSNIVLKKRGSLAPWVLLLSIITFGLSLLGTFLVRSGAITSVHSFASDPERGIYILGYMFISIGGALLLYAVRGGKIATETDEQILPASREGLIIINNLFLLTACISVFLGTLYPMFAEIFADEKLTVGAPFFEATFAPLMAIPLIFAAITPFMAWKKANLRATISSLTPALLAVFAVIILVLAFFKTKLISAILGFGLSAWLIVGSISWLLNSGGKRGKYSVFCGHIGAACMIAGITASSAYKSETEGLLGVGQSLKIAGYEVIYQGITNFENDNFTANRAELLVKNSSDTEITNLQPEYRTYKIRGVSTSETAIYSSIYGDLYSAIGETKDGKTAIRLYFKPMIYLLWLGFMIISASGIISITRKRE